MRDLNASDFEKVIHDRQQVVEPLITSHTFWQDAFYRFKKNRGAVFSLFMILLILLLSIFGPYFNNYPYDKVEKRHGSLPPRIKLVEKLGIFDGTIRGINMYERKRQNDAYHFFGTDKLGRDLWSRTWMGTRVSFYIAFLAVVLDMFIGIVFGMISGYKGGKVDVVMQRFIEVLVGIPNLVVVTLFVLILNPGILSISLALIITGWIGMSRVVRAQVLKLKEFEFILASRTLGSSTTQIIKNDILPNIFSQVIIMSMFSIPGAIFYESFLAFIGLGLQPPQASLGVLIADGYKSIMIYPHMILFPVIVLSLLMLSFNLLADGLRDAFDPKMKEE
jgi:oligopeptide transport system permease protein